MTTLFQFLERSVQKYGDKTALKITREGATIEWSFTELKGFAERTAAYLESQGILPGERVAVIAPNMPEWVGLYFGCHRLGAVLVPLDVQSSPGFVRRIVEITDARLVFVSKDLKDKTSNLTIPVAVLEELPTLVSETAFDPAMPHPSGNDLALLMFTSGTTAEPKGVMLSHRNVVSNTISAYSVVPSKPSYRLLSLLPLSHMLEQTVGLLAPIFGGAAIVYATSRQPRVILQTMRDEKITTMILVPQVLRLFWAGIEREVEAKGRTRVWNRMLKIAPHLPMKARRMLFKQVHQSLGGHLEFLMTGGAYIDPSLIEKWEALGIPVLQGYGATEASPIVTASSVRTRRADSVGKVVPGVELRLAEDGEILVRGDSIASGYWRSPELTRSSFEDGWYLTGDIGEMDAQGFLRLRGRKKDVIVLDNGMNVYAQDVEEALKAHASVRDAAVFGVRSRAGRTAIHSVLLLAGEGAEPRLIAAEVNRNLSEHQRIQDTSVWPLEDFPRTHTLKVKKREIVDWLRSAQVAEPV